MIALYREECHGDREDSRCQKHGEKYSSGDALEDKFVIKTKAFVNYLIPSSIESTLKPVEFVTYKPAPDIGTAGYSMALHVSFK